MSERVGLKIRGFDAKNSEYLKLYNGDEINNLANDKICSSFKQIFAFIVKRSD